MATMSTTTATSPGAEQLAGAPQKLTFAQMFRTADGRNHAFTFALVSMLFLLWGTCNGMIDILNKHFQNSLQISKFESGFVQSANYLAYFFMALPAGLIARRIGYKGGILIGLGLIAAGAFWFIPATRIGTFAGFLTGLFVLAAGLACLETVANPYTTVLGPPEGAAARINLAQTCNGVGWMIGPLMGKAFMSSTAEVNRSNENLYLPYLGIGIVVTILFVVFVFNKIPDVNAEEDTRVAKGTSLRKRPHFVFAVITQGLYVLAQIGIFGFFVNYVTSEMPAGYNVTDWRASVLLSFGGFGLFLLGRVVGTQLLRSVKPERLLATYAVACAIAMLLVILPLGWVSVGGLFISFFFMSIMFPTIFSLGISGLGAETKRASAFIVMSIVGGALSPLMGLIADKTTMRMGFIVPLIGFGAVFLYAISWQKLRRGSAA
jgi:FHS family L-fucose permease-like MFS transporter